MTFRCTPVAFAISLQPARVCSTPASLEGHVAVPVALVCSIPASLECHFVAACWRLSFRNTSSKLQTQSFPSRHPSKTHRLNFKHRAFARVVLQKHINTASRFSSLSSLFSSLFFLFFDSAQSSYLSVLRSAALLQTQLCTTYRHRKVPTPKRKNTNTQTSSNSTSYDLQAP